jgi:uncharacterized SAM-binding protein YcdF (DUF218 family)
LNGNFPFKLRFVIQFEVSEETTMEATELDVIIVLGVQLFRSYDKIEPAPHTTNRIKAATIAFQTGLCNRFIISGGYNVGISYSLETNTIFTTKRRDFKSCALARFQGPSEAWVIAQSLIEKGIPENSLILEKCSTFTIENTFFTSIILKRYFTDLGNTKIGILTSCSHISRALKAFKDCGVNTIPVIAEKLISKSSGEI